MTERAARERQRQTFKLFYCFFRICVLKISIGTLITDCDEQKQSNYTEKKSKTEHNVLVLLSLLRNVLTFWEIRYIK